jgi:hypothetical protein
LLPRLFPFPNLEWTGDLIDKCGRCAQMPQGCYPCPTLGIRCRLERPLRQLARVARCPACPSLVFWLCSEVAVSGDAMTQKQCFAIFGTRALACATPPPSLLHRYRNRILLGGQRRGACRLSPGSHQRSVQTIVQKMYAHRPPLIISFPIPQCACSSVDVPSVWPFIKIGESTSQWWPGDVCRAALVCDGER